MSEAESIESAKSSSFEKRCSLKCAGCVLLASVAFLFLVETAPGNNVVGDRLEDKDTNRWSVLNNRMDEKSDGDKIMTKTKNDAYYFPKPSTEIDYWPIVPDHHWTHMPRPFRTHSSTESWCHRRENRTETSDPQGLILVKVHKAASSTLAGINFRIAHHVGSRTLGNNLVCQSYQNHGDSRKYQNRDPARSFLYASIRDPGHRALSWVFYTLSNREINITEAVVMARLQSRSYFVSAISGRPDTRSLNESGAQTGYMNTECHLQKPLWSSQQPSRVQNLSLAISRVEQIMGQYDFLLVVERFQESLVALQLLLGLRTTDLLYVSAKTNGGYAHTGMPNPGCHRIQKTVVFPRVRKFLNSQTFLAQNYQDYLLYRAANRSLDMTIEALGRDRFDQALSKYQAMLEESKDCEKEARFPCDSEGNYHNRTNCYRRDWGCSYPCLDRRFGK